MGRLERHFPNHMNSARPTAAAWIGSAFCAALVLAALVLATLGTEERGTHVALQVTARFAFLLFWPAYAAGADLIYRDCFRAPSNEHAAWLWPRVCSALLVHLALVAWLTYIGATPPLEVFLVFGIAALWTYLLALSSIARLQQKLGPGRWWFLRGATNYIAYAFAVDFLKYPQFSSIKYLVGYLPFAILSVVGPLLCLCRIPATCCALS